MRSDIIGSTAVAICVCGLLAAAAPARAEPRDESGTAVTGQGALGDPRGGSTPRAVASPAVRSDGSPYKGGVEGMGRYDGDKKGGGTAGAPGNAGSAGGK